MKTYLTLIAIILTVSTAFAADTIEVISPSLVKRNGANSGSVANFIATNPQFATEVNAGLLAWETATKAAADAKAAEAEKMKADATTKADAALKRIREKKAKEEASGKGKRWDALDELEGELNVTATDIRKAELQSQIDALKEQLKNAK